MKIEPIVEKPTELEYGSLLVGSFYEAFHKMNLCRIDQWLPE
jgi:hypothetical protein